MRAPTCPTLRWPANGPQRAENLTATHSSHAATIWSECDTKTSAGDFVAGQPLHGFNNQIIEAGAPGVIDVVDKLLAHPAFPEFLEMIRHSGNRFLPWIGAEEIGDLIGHVNHAVSGHARLRILVVKRLVSSCCDCHSDIFFAGFTCTAVTLYSGQLVAQSENSVVTTLAPVMAWWKVV